MTSDQATTRYPVTYVERDRWIRERRPLRNVVDPWKPYGAFVETEPDGEGGEVSIATILLSNRECPFRCVMCDLWQNTLEKTVPLGAIPAQIRLTLDQLPATRAIKLYNAGSFFDPGAIPPEDYPEIAQLVRGFERVIVECHPAFAGPRVLEFRNLLEPRLEVAMGLETVHPEVLRRLNKRMTVEQFRTAAEFLRENDLDLRVFLLVRPPWLSEAEGLEWARRSLEVAMECGASTCCLIPTRGGNGALEALAELGEFAPPSLLSLEAALEYGLERFHGRGRVFADVWDIRRFAVCPECAEARIQRLERMNRTQVVMSAVRCACTGA